MRRLLFLSVLFLLGMLSLFSFLLISRASAGDFPKIEEVAGRGAKLVPQDYQQPGGAIVRAAMLPGRELSTLSSGITFFFESNVPGFFEVGKYYVVRLESGGKFRLLTKQADNDRYLMVSSQISENDIHDLKLNKEGAWDMFFWKSGSRDETYKREDERIVPHFQYSVLPPGTTADTVPTITAPDRVDGRDSDLCIPIKIENAMQGIPYTVWFEGDKLIRPENVFKLSDPSKTTIEGKCFKTSVTSKENKELCMEVGSYGTTIGVTCRYKTKHIQILQEPVTSAGTVTSKSTTRPSTPVKSLGPQLCISTSGQSGIKTALGCVATEDTNAFVSWFLGWAVGIAGGVAFLFILFAGFQIMTASGNPERLQHGRELLTAAISGLILIIFSVFLLRLIGVEILNLPGFGLVSQ